MATESGERNSPLIAIREGRECEMNAKATVSKIRSLYVAHRERRWDRERSRRITAMLRSERATIATQADWLEAMAIQLVEIRTLPEAAHPSR
jgi:hypothetical protein